MTNVPAVDAPPADQPVAPVTAARRIDSLDVLRGFAVLGILIMNIQTFGLPMMAYMNPTVGDRFTGADHWVWTIGHLLADLKFMSIFSMLFGAGVVLFTSRLESRSRSSIGLHYRRMGWLLVIGMLHAYLLWYGDILVMYSLCGMLLFWVRRFPAWALFLLSAILLMVTPALMALFGFSFGRMQTALQEYDAQTVAIVAPAQPGESPELVDDAAETIPAEPDEANAESEVQPDSEIDPETSQLLWGMSVKDVRLQLTEMEKQWSPPQEDLDKEVEAMRGSYTDELIYRAPVVIMMQIFMVLLYSWRVLSMMLLGMALFKWSVLSATRSTAAYLAMMVLGLGIGVPMIWMGLQRNIAVDFYFIDAQFNNAQFNYFGSVCVALGWVGMIMLLCRTGVLSWLSASLGAVGRMAFTNYIMHTVICTTIFNGRSGLGFAQFNQFDRVQLLMVVLGVFIFQMIASPIWLKYFRFGPLEWLWRSLTYWKLQPMRRAS